MSRSQGTELSTFNNSGLFRKEVATAPTNIDGGVRFVNTGSVEGTAGTLAFTSTSTSSGTYLFSSGTVLAFTTGPHTFDAASSVTAATVTVNGNVTINGIYEVASTSISGGNLTITHDAVMSSLSMTAGTLTVSGDLTVTGSLSWTGGTMAGAGTTILAEGATATASPPTYGDVVLSARTLRNDGTFIWAGSGSIRLNNGAVFDNPGTFLARCNPYPQTGGGVMSRSQGTELSTFNNSGLFRKEVFTAPTNIDGGICFVNTGLVDVDTGILRFSGCYPSLTGAYAVASTLQIDSVPVPDCSQGSITLETSGATIINGSGQSLVGRLDCIDSTGALNVVNGKNQTIPGALQNSGSVNVGTGSTLTAGGNYTQTGGSTIVEGTLGAPLIDIVDGLVRAQGVFNGDTRNAGRLEIGVPIGVLSINGYYHQTATGILAFDIGGLIAGVEYDQLQVSEPAVFDGTLEISLANQFTPTEGDCFDLILYPSQTGTFADIVTPDLPGSLDWTVEYGETAFRLCVVRGAASIAGTVTSDCDGALVGVTVTLVDGNGETRSDDTNAGGAYAFADVPVSDNPGELSFAVPEGFHFVATVPVALDSGDQTVNVEATCKFVSVTGVVTSACGGGPLEGVSVSLESGGMVLRSTATGADGTYTIDGIRYSAVPAELSLTAPEGYEQPSAAPVNLTADQNVDVALDCLSMTVSGIVSSDCEGPLGGVAVSLIDGGGNPSSTETAPDGSYSLGDIPQSSSPGQLSFDLGAGYDAVAPIQVALDAGDQSVDVAATCRFVSVAGIVSSECGGPILGVTVDLQDANGGFHTTTTDGSGAYLFEDLRYSATADGAEISIVIPLGYEAVSPGVAGTTLTLDQDRAVTFTLECLDPTGEPRSMGYWKHNASVYLPGGHGAAQESEENMEVAYPDAIFSHFHENQLNGITVSGVTYMGVPAAPLDLETIHATLSVRGNAGMLAKAKQQYLAFLLNVASGKLLTSSIVSNDGATASQTLQYVADLITGDNGAVPVDHELAKNIGDTINSARILAGGMVPLDLYQNIGYRLDQFVNVALQVSPNPGGGDRPYVFSFGAPRVGRATLEIFDVSGRRVATPFSGEVAPGPGVVVWDGVGTDGHAISQGLYFVRLTTDEGVKRLKFVHVTP